MYNRFYVCLNACPYVCLPVCLSTFQSWCYQTSSSVISSFIPYNPSSNGTKGHNQLYICPNACLLVCMFVKFSTLVLPFESSVRLSLISFLPEASFGLRVLSSPASVCVCQSLACPPDSLGPVQARIAKFGPKMQKILVKVLNVLGGS